MKKNEEITDLAYDIMVDITDARIPLHNAILKASRLSLMINLPKNVDLFKSWAKDAEKNQITLDRYSSDIAAAQDPNISVSSSNPSEKVTGFGGLGLIGNSIERNSIRGDAKSVSQRLSNYRAETYVFVSGISPA